MGKKNPLEGYRVAPAQKFVCKAIPSGKKFTGKHIFPFDAEPPLPRRWWFVTAGAVAAALGAGVAIGRFLLR